MAIPFSIDPPNLFESQITLSERQFAWRRMAGDFIVTARASGGEPAGWLARAGLEPGAPEISAFLTGGGQPVLAWRRDPGGPVEEVRLAVGEADVIQLERRGDLYILSAARFGRSFQTLEVGGFDLGEALHVGLFAGASAGDTVFDNVRLVKPAGPGFSRERDPFHSRLEILDLESGRREIVYDVDYVLEAPNWTRDGQALIYNSGGRLFRFDLATREPAQIDTGDVVHNNNDHVLSFDGSMLAISSHLAPDYHSRIYTVPLTGRQPRLVTPDGPSYLHGWSPDGQFLVYTALRNGDYDIYRIAVDGGLEEQLTSETGLDDGPEYSPDGSFIYFNSVRSGRMQIWRMQLDGSRPEQLTDDEYNNWFPHLAPDGKTVLLLTYLPGEVEPSDHPAAKRVYLRRMPADGGSPVVEAYLYGGQGTMNVPSWSPDGTKAAFVSNTLPLE